MMKRKVTISWSGGKDSAFSLFKILSANEYDVVGLHTVINKETNRVGMHGVREALIERQAEALSLPLTKLYLESTGDHSAYEKLMRTFYLQCTACEITGVVFGDIFLEDLKVFRENLLKNFNLKGIFPLWKLDSEILMHDFIAIGFKTIICSANTKYFSSEEMGKTIDKNFIATLPAGVDPCGENGEFHTFVYDGPIFKEPIKYYCGEIVSKTYDYQTLNSEGSKEKMQTAFWFQDLLP